MSRMWEYLTNCNDDLERKREQFKCDEKARDALSDFESSLVKAIGWI